MKKRHYVLALLVSLSVITFLDRVCISVTGPRMQDELGITPERWGWILGAFVLSYGLFQVPLGVWADRAGQRRVLAAIVLWWSLFTGLTGLASGFVALIAVRFLFGIGEAGAYPAMSGAVSRWLPSTVRARAQGLIWGASRAGGALSPLLVVPVQEHLGWRAAFWILGAVGFAWVAVWLWWSRDNPSEQPGITREELDELGPAKQPAGGPALPWKQLFASRQLWLIMAMYWCYVWGSWFYFSWLHTFLVKGRGFDQSEMAIYSAFPFALGVFANVAGGFLSDHLSKLYGLKFGRCLMGSASLAVAAILLASAALVPGKPGVVILLSLSFGVMDLMLPSAWAVCLDVGRKHAGVVTGAMNTAGNLGGFACTVLFGYIVTAFGYNAPLLVIASMLMISALLFTRIDPTKPLVAEETEPVGGVVAC
jgi:MFS family permease